MTPLFFCCSFFFGGKKNPKVTRDMLNDKISELNSAIDGVSQQLQSRSTESQVENL